MSRSGLVVGPGIPVAHAHQDEVRHRRLLAEAVNHVAAAAYTPETLWDEETADTAFSQAGADLGLSVSVTPFVPARAHILLIVQVANFAAAAALVGTLAEFQVTVPAQDIFVPFDAGMDGETVTIPAQDVTIPQQAVSVAPASDAVEATVALKEDGATIASHVTSYPASGGSTSYSLVLQSVRDLEPNVTYAYTATGTETAAAKDVRAVHASLSVRVEHRRLTP